MPPATDTRHWKTAQDVPIRERIAEPALLIVDMQNDFVRAGAPLEVADARATIPKIRLLMDAFRVKGLPVVYTRFYVNETPDLMWLWSPPCREEIKSCWRGVKRQYADIPGSHECADVIGELAPLPGDAVIDKFGYGAFHATDLEARLRALDVRSLVITGTVTQICVEETAREAFHHGYRTTVISDAVSSYAPDLHAAALRNFAMKFGWVADTSTVLGWLRDPVQDSQRSRFIFTKSSSARFV